MRQSWRYCWAGGCMSGTPRAGGALPRPAWPASHRKLLQSIKFRSIFAFSHLPRLELIPLGLLRRVLISAVTQTRSANPEKVGLPYWMDRVLEEHSKIGDELAAEP